MPILDSIFPFRRKRKPVSASMPDVAAEPLPPMVIRTLVIVYEPTMDVATGTKLCQALGTQPGIGQRVGLISQI